MRKPYLGATDVLYCSADGQHHAARIIKVQEGHIVSLAIFPADPKSTPFQSRKNVPYCGEEGTEGWMWNDAIEHDTYSAGQIIQGHRIVTLNADQEVVYPSLANCDTEKLLGLSLNAADRSGTVEVQPSGCIAESSWTWQPDKRLFLDVDGQLTQSVPQSGPLVILGAALSATSIFLAIKPVILRA